MDELDDLAAFGLAEVDEDRAAGEYADPHAPAVGAVLTTAQAVELAEGALRRLTIRPPGSGRGEPLFAWINDRDADCAALATGATARHQWARAAEAQLGAADVASAIPNIEPTEDGEWLDATERTEAATRRYRAAGGDA